MKLSHLSETLQGSEIVKLGGEIRDRIRQGETIYNFTVGDFDPAIFPIPQQLEDAIIEAYRQRQTNYPPADGNADLRQELSLFTKTNQGLNYAEDEILVASGGRPLIYALYRVICDPGDKILYAAPSWNNNHYTHFVEGEHVMIKVDAANHFMPTAEELRPHIQEATLIALCSPQNPTGTTFRKENLMAICELIVAENKRRGADEKKLYLLYDQMYWQLTMDEVQHYDPVGLLPEMRPYTVYVDAISKVFASTGLRVGWSLGPKEVLNKMKAILSHVGAWAPMPEQKGVVTFLRQPDAVRDYLVNFRKEIKARLMPIYAGLVALKEKGYPIDAIAPEAAIYLTIKIDLAGKKKKNGTVLHTQRDVTDFLLQEAHLAMVPFYMFGASDQSPWYRLSVGMCKKEDIPAMLQTLEKALASIE